MKYHSNLKTVLISLAVLLIFASTAGLILFELNLTSPTLIVTDRLFSQLSDMDSTFSFEAKAVERNLRDRVRVKDVRVLYEKEQIAAFDYLEIKMSLIDLFRYFLTGNNSADVYFHNGSITIPSQLFENIKTTDSSSNNNSSFGQNGFKMADIHFSEVLKKYHFSIQMEDFDLIVGNYASFRNVAAELSLGGSLRTTDVALYIPEFVGTYNGMTADMKYIGLTFRYTDSYEIKAMFDQVDISSGDEFAIVDKLTVAASIDENLAVNLDNLKARLSVDGVDIASGSYGMAKLETISGGFSALDKSLALQKISYQKDDYNVEITDVHVQSPDLNDFEGKIGMVLGAAYGVDIRLSNLGATYNLDEKKGTLDVAHASTSTLKEFTNDFIGESSFEKIHLEGVLDHSGSVLFSAKTTLGALNENLKDFTSDIIVSGSYDDTEIKDFDVELNNLYLGFGSQYSNLRLAGNLDMAEFQFQYGAMADLKGHLSVNEKAVDGNISLQSLLISEFTALLGKNAEVVGNLTKEDSAVNGTASLSFMLDEKAKYRFSGDTVFDLYFNSLHYNTFETNLRLSSSLLKNTENVKINYLNVETDFMKASVDGKFDLEQMLPDINYSFALSNDTSLFTGSLQLGGYRIYEYNATIPRYKNSYMKGTVDFTQEGRITASNVLKTGNTTRNFDFEMDLEEKLFSVSSSKLQFSGDYSDSIRLIADFNRMDTVVDGYGNPIYVDGLVQFDFDKSAKNFTINSDMLTISDLWFVPSKPSVSFSLDGNQDMIDVHGLTVSNDEENLYSGESKYDFKNRSFTLVLNEQDADGRFVLSVYKDEFYAGILKAENMDLGILGINGMVGNANLAGRAAELKDFTFTGSINAKPMDENNDNRKLTGKLAIDASSIRVDDIRFTNTGLDLSIPSITYDSVSGDFSSKKISLYMKGEHKDRDYPINVNFDIEGNLTQQDSIYSAIFNIIRDRGNGVLVDFNLNSLDIDNSHLLVQNCKTLGKMENSVLYLDGTMAKGRIDLHESVGNLEIDVLPIAKFAVDFDYKNSLCAQVKLDGFNMYLMNMFFKTPLLVFKDDILKGDIGIDKNDEGFRLNGNLYADELSLEVFWAPDQLVTMQNPKFTVWDNDIRTALTPTTVLNYESYSATPIDMIVGFAFSPSLSFEGYDAEVFVSENQKLKFRVPLPDTNIDILGYFNGHYKFTGYDGRVTNDGNLNLLDTEVSIGMNPYPDWYELGGEMFIDLNFNFTRNNVIKYPAGPNPIVSIVIADNANMFFHFGRDGMKATGELSLRGGEIFYFQKYFYVIEGNIQFDNMNELNPRISLKAALRDYDSNGNKVEIYLVMKDNTFDNISPSFESSPQMEISEIMGILGQSILSSSTYGTVSVSSMASLVTESVDVLSKLGVIERSETNANLNTSIKRVFNLDTFSLHTNILNNIVTDSISSAAFENIKTYTPIARYLNGTTLNIGKYLSPDLYLQARINLDLKKDRNSYTLFADDLALDTEISLEWNNPAFTVTFFSTPKYLSFHSFFETFGFTIKKTFKF